MNFYEGKDREAKLWKINKENVDTPYTSGRKFIIY